MAHDPELEIESHRDDSDDAGGILHSYKLHTDRLNVLLGRWLEAVRVVTDREDEIVLDALRHRLKLTLDDVTHENMMKIVSYSVAAQFGDAPADSDAS